MAIWAAALPQKLSATRVAQSAPAPRRYMPGAPEIYFHKAIDNSRLVRSVDPGRKREMHFFAGAMVFCFLVILLYLGQHCSSIEYGYKIEAQRTQLDQLAETNRTLQLEEATLKDPERISALAQQMGMSLPVAGQVQRMEDSGTSDGAPVMARNNIAVVSVPN
ncbi:MAG: cell division protein FtsL [Acidobacteriota bacterium]|nr:cell division protein FtsL [Acidobacteriota bacterium]